MDLRLPSIDWFMRTNKEIPSREAMTDLTKIFDLGLLSNSFIGEQSIEEIDNLYHFYKDNDNNNISNIPTEMKYPNWQVTSFTQVAGDHAHYPYQGPEHIVSNSRTLWPIGQENGLYQNTDDNWRNQEESTNSWDNRTQQKGGHEIDQGTPHIIVRNHDIAGGSFSSFDQIVNSDPTLHQANFHIGRDNDTISTTPTLDAHLDYFDNTPATNRAGHNFGESSNSMREHDGELSLLDFNHRRENSSAFQTSTENDITQLRNAGTLYPDSAYLQHTSAESPNNVDNETSIYLGDDYRTLINDKACHLYDFHIVNDNSDYNRNNETSTDIVQGGGDAGSKFYNSCEDNWRNNDTQISEEIASALSPNLNGSMYPEQSHSGRYKTIHRDSKEYTSSNNEITDTGQNRYCDFTHENNNGHFNSSGGSSEDEPHSTATKDDIGPLPELTTLLKKGNPNPSTSVPSPMPSNDDERDDSLGDLVRNALNFRGKKDFNYIALISSAIFSSPEKRMLLSEIYEYISKTYNLSSSYSPSWRNSIRHNLSLNECFVQLKRLGKGRGNYWTIHPACIEDFAKGDFRRRQARRQVQRNTKRVRRAANGPQNENAEFQDKICQFV